MDTAEFSNQFDILYNNVNSNQAPGLDEYEKSVFLTKAQEEIVKDYFNPVNNKLGQGFDGSTRRQYDFSTLLKTVELQEIPNELLTFNTIDPRSRLYVLPSDYYLEVNNNIELSNGKILAGASITYALYSNYLNTPYQLPSKRIFWKLTHGNYIDNKTFEDYKFYIYRSEDAKSFIALKVPTDVTVTITSGSTTSVIYSIDTKKLTLQYSVTAEGDWEKAMNALKAKLETEGYKDISIIRWDSADYGDSPTGYNITDNQCCEVILNQSYIIKNNILRYIRRPKPIILANLDEGFSISGESKITECELPAALHEEILQRAIELAKVIYLGNTGDPLTVGSVSSTDIGIIATNRQ